MLRKYRIYVLTGYSNKHQNLFNKLEEIFSNLIKKGKYYIYKDVKYLEMGDDLFINYMYFWHVITCYYNILDEEFRILITYMVNNKLGYSYTYTRCFGINLW